MLDSLLKNNPICRVLANIVNFCNEQSIFEGKILKFSEKNPFNNTEDFLKVLKENQKPVITDYKTRFIFNSGVNVK